MKKLRLIWLFFLPVVVFSQNDFEGIITYKGSRTSDKKTFQVRIFFSDNKMKLKVVGNDLSDPEMNKSEIYDYKTGLHYTIFEEEKIFSIDSMDNFSFEDNKSALRDTTLRDNILGNQCKAYVVTPEQNVNFPIDLVSIVWFSDSVKFIVPEKYRHKRGIESLPDGNMLFLKMEVFINFGADYDDEDKDDLFFSKPDSVFLIANKIERIKLNASEFLPPANYIFSNYERPLSRDSVRVRELTLTELTQEEVIKPEPPPPPPPKEPKPLKSSSKKTKQTKPVKG